MTVTWLSHDCHMSYILGQSLDGFILMAYSEECSIISIEKQDFVILLTIFAHIPACARMCPHVPACARMCPHVPACARMCLHVPAHSRMCPHSQVSIGESQKPKLGLIAVVIIWAVWSDTASPMSWPRAERELSKVVALQIRWSYS